jgi:hypothetical protein
VPLAERVCFINNHEFGFEGKVTLSAKSLQKRGRNVVDIELMDYPENQSFPRNYGCGSRWKQARG